MNDFLTYDDTKDKTIFWDIDGVLAPFRFDGKLAYLREQKDGFKKIDEGAYYNRLPSRFMQGIVKTCGAKKQIVLGHKINQKEVDDKIEWIERYYPEIDEYIFIDEDRSKAFEIWKYVNLYNIDLKDVIFIDDTHAIIQEGERLGIPSWHISSLLDWGY